MQSFGPGSVDAHVEVLAAELRVARHRHRTHPEAGEHREHPLDPASDQGHHRVPALDAARGHRAGEPGAACDQLAEMPLAPLPSALIATIPSREAAEGSMTSSMKFIGSKSAAAPGWVDFPPWGT